MRKKGLALWGLWLVFALGIPNAAAGLVINEFLADPPPGLAGDANRDGIRHSSADEFVELFNNGPFPERLLGWSLRDGVGVRHEFSTPDPLGPGEYFVVFGGGALPAPGGLFETASTGSLSLNNSGDIISLKDPFGTIIDFVRYGAEGGQNQSLTRSPEGYGPFSPHQTVSRAGLLYSPGRDADGTFSGENTRSIPEPLTLGMVMAGLAGLGMRSFLAKNS